MLQALLLAGIQYLLPVIINAVVAHQKANAGTSPTPDQLMTTVPELAILAQGQAFLAAQAKPV